MTELRIDFSSAVPVYDQIKKQIKHAIARDKLAKDHSLPSIRELASFLRVNPNTVARAYRELSQEKIITGRPGIGFWIENFEMPGHEKMNLLQEEFLIFLEKAVEMGFSRESLQGLITDFLKGKK